MYNESRRNAAPTRALRESVNNTTQSYGLRKRGTHVTTPTQSSSRKESGLILNIDSDLISYEDETVVLNQTQFSINNITTIGSLLNDIRSYISYNIECTHKYIFFLLIDHKLYRSSTLLMNIPDIEYKQILLCNQLYFQHHIF